MPDPSQEHMDILAQLDTILESNDFSASNRFRDFLRFVVEETLAGRENELKAYTIATCVFGRDKSFDPLLDPVVRVEAAKLRNKLENFYLKRAGTGKDVIKIEIPKGTYVPVFNYIDELHHSNLLPNNEAQAGQNNLNSTDPATGKLLPGKDDGPAHTALQKVSIAILPFANISSSREIDHLLSGMAEELAIALTKFDDITVISAHAMHMENFGTTDPNTFSSALGARFILYGSAQLDNKIIRVRIKLADTATHSTLWAEKFDEPYTATGLFGIIDTTVCQVAAQIGDSFGYIKRTLFNEFPVQRTGELKAYEAILYYHHWAANLHQDRFIKAKEALDFAIEADPGYALAHAMLSDIYAAHYQWGYTLFPNDLEMQQKLADRAVELDPHCQHAQWAKAYGFYLTREREQFEHLARLALSINPSDTNIAAAVGQKLAMAGNWDEGLEIIETAIHLNPFLPSWFRTATYTYNYINEDYELALSEAKRINTPHMGHMLRAAAYGALGIKDAAKSELEEFLTVNPGFTQNHQELLLRIFFQDSVVKALMKGFKNAGL